MEEEPNISCELLPDDIKQDVLPGTTHIARVEFKGNSISAMGESEVDAYKSLVAACIHYHLTRR